MIEYFQEQASYAMVKAVPDPVLSHLPQSCGQKSEAYRSTKRFWARSKPAFYAGLLRKIVSSFHRGHPLNDHKSFVILNWDTQHPTSLPEQTESLFVENMQHH